MDEKVCFKSLSFIVKFLPLHTKKGRVSGGVIGCSGSTEVKICHCVVQFKQLDVLR